MRIRLFYPVLSLSCFFLCFNACFSQSTKATFLQWAPKPPMGWNSYDAYYGCITESQFKEEVDHLFSAYYSHGYRLAVIDYCWFNPGPEDWDASHWITYDVDFPYLHYGKHFRGMQMDGFGRLMPALNRFPSARDHAGFKLLASYVHRKGMLFGIHVMRGIPREAVWKNLPIFQSRYHARDIADLKDSCTWNQTMYGVNPDKQGAQQYYNSLLNLYASWGVDFIKVDDIAAPKYHKKEIEMIRRAIDQCGRKMVLSLSPGDAPASEAFHIDAYSNMYRIINDVWDHWDDLLHDFDLLNAWSAFIGGGSWPDADMLPLGKLCITGYPYAHGRPQADKGEHYCRLTPEEQKTMVTLWSIARAPLIWGGSALYSDSLTHHILCNDAILDIDQNSVLNHEVYEPSSRADTKDYRIWCATSKDGSKKYIAFFNLTAHPLNGVFYTSWENWPSNMYFKELWSGATGIFKDGCLKIDSIPSHGVKIYCLIASTQ